MFTSIWACCRAKMMLKTSRPFSRSWKNKLRWDTDPSEFNWASELRGTRLFSSLSSKHSQNLGPPPFLVYMLLMGSMFRKKHVFFHIFADDLQIYLSLKTSDWVTIVDFTCLLILSGNITFYFYYSRFVNFRVRWYLIWIILYNWGCVNVLHW